MKCKVISESAGESKPIFHNHVSVRATMAGPLLPTTLHCSHSSAIGNGVLGLLGDSAGSGGGTDSTAGAKCLLSRYCTGSLKHWTIWICKRNRAGKWFNHKKAQMRHNLWYKSCIFLHTSYINAFLWQYLKKHHQYNPTERKREAYCTWCILSKNGIPNVPKTSLWKCATVISISFSLSISTWSRGIS